MTNPGHADIDDDLETLSLTSYVCADKGSVSLPSGHVPVNTACSTGCASVGYSPTPVGVDGKLHPPPTPPATP